MYRYILQYRLEQRRQQKLETAGSRGMVYLHLATGVFAQGREVGWLVGGLSSTSERARSGSGEG